VNEAKEEAMSRKLSATVIGGLLCAQVQPALGLIRSGGVGPRGGTWEHQQGAVRSGTEVQGPHGGQATHGQGPAGSGTAVEGPHGGTATARQSYDWNGVHYARPTYSSTQVNVYRAPYVGYPGFHSYYSYGLVEPLVPFAGLAFLSAGMLIGSYAAQQKTVYVYIVNEGGTNMQYEVSSTGEILSSKPVE
jgi:hypothetical protein